MQTSILAKKTIEQAKKIAIFGHMSPDGDCIGAMLGLGRLLEKQKKTVKYFVPNTPSRIYDFIKNIKRLKSNFDYKHYDLLIFVDFTGLGRMGIISQAKPDYFKEKPIIVFDHHRDDVFKQGIIIKDVHSVSACEILFEYTYKRWPKLYDKDIATYFYLGITSDSGNFLFEEDHIRTLTNAIKLLEQGADKDLIINNLFRKKSLGSVKFLNLLLSRIKQKDYILYTYYEETELKTYGIEHEEADYALHIIQNIEGPKIVLLARKTEEVIRVSLRAQKTGNIDCTMIAKIFGGGGHRLAAAFRVPVNKAYEDQISDIIQTIHRKIKMK